MLELDQEVSNWFAAHRHRGLTQAMLLVSDLHQTAKLLAATALVALAFGLGGPARRRAHRAGGARGHAAQRGAEACIRPRAALHEDPLVQIATYSFPSGHAVASTVFYGMLCVLVFAHVRSRWLRAAAVAVAVSMVLVVGFSRVYLGAHFPSDVIAGVAVGTLCLLLFLRIAGRPSPATRAFLLREAADHLDLGEQLVDHVDAAGVVDGHAGDHAVASRQVAPAAWPMASSSSPRSVKICTLPKAPSVTYRRPSSSQARARGRANWPSAVPTLPKVRRKLPSASKVCTRKLPGVQHVQVAVRRDHRLHRHVELAVAAAAPADLLHQLAVLAVNQHAVLLAVVVGPVDHVDAAAVGAGRDAGGPLHSVGLPIVSRCSPSVS